MEEEAFIFRLKTGDQEAFRDLVSQFNGAIFNTASGILQNMEDAEDITQEVFMEVFRSVEGFKGQSKLSTWIYRITVSKSLEMIRKRNRKKRFGLMKSLEEIRVEPVPELTAFYHPGVRLENKEHAAILFKSINKLPEKQKAAFILHKMEDLSYSEIAEVMNMSLSSIESLLFRARQNLRIYLSDYYEKNIR